MSSATEIKIKVMHGPNLNMLQYRQQDIYGSLSYEALLAALEEEGKTKGLSHNIIIELSTFQSNHEGALIDEVQQLINNADYDALIINPGALAHYSYALRDALEMLKIIKVEVHLSDITTREDFRQKDVIAEVCDVMFYGKQLGSYFAALDYIIDKSRY